MGLPCSWGVGARPRPPPRDDSAPRRNPQQGGLYLHMGLGLEEKKECNVSIEIPVGVNKRSMDYVTHLLPTKYNLCLFRVGLSFVHTVL